MILHKPSRYDWPFLLVFIPILFPFSHFMKPIKLFLFNDILHLPIISPFSPPYEHFLTQFKLELVYFMRILHLLLSILIFYFFLCDPQISSNKLIRKSINNYQPLINIHLYQLLYKISNECIDLFTIFYFRSQQKNTH